MTAELPNKHGSFYTTIMYLTLAIDGAEHLPALLNGQSLTQLDEALRHLPTDRPGIRLTDAPWLEKWLSPDGAIGTQVAHRLNRPARPVRAILFDKTASTNWSLAWHQDRTIAVKARVDTPGFGPWTVKSGIQHVMPPQVLLNNMLTIRIHLDAVDYSNAPLIIAPGSHTLGVVSEDRIRSVVAQCGNFACLAEAGDAWVYATPILHASEVAKNPRRRRVLQVDYSADTLPSPLEWLGI